MNALAALALVACIATLIAMAIINAGREPGAYILFSPPYNYQFGDYWSELNAFFFVFVASLLFFGLGAPIALGIEGAKHASSLLLGAPLYDLLFLMPAFFAAVSATWLGLGLWADFKGTGYVFGTWTRAAAYFDVALILLAVLLALRPTIVG